MHKARSSPWKRRSSTILAGTSVLFVAGLAALPSCNNADKPDGSAAKCGPEAYFTDTAWPEVFSKCVQCHVAGGVSGTTRFVLKPSTTPDASTINFRIVQRAARKLLENNTSLLLLKPTGLVAHAGGVLVAPGSDAETTLKKMVSLAQDTSQDTACGVNDSGVPTGVALMDGHATLRKAALQIVGRLPTANETSLVDPETLAGLDKVLRGMMTEKAFGERVKEIFNDTLLTDALRFETGQTLVNDSVPQTILDQTAPPCISSIGSNWQNYEEATNSADSRLCISASEALAREPLEMIAHVVQSDRPFTEILTAQYRYLNYFSATVVGADLGPFAGHENDRDFFLEAKAPLLHAPAGLPEEYAGVISTSAFLYRYNSTSTNRNRGRAYRFYKYFLDNDILRSAVRVDISKVDPSSHPWLTDAQCTGCHSSIDPVAGAFQHWTNCYDIQQVQYYDTRYCGNSGGDWFPPDDMLPPGVGPGTTNTLAMGDIPTALSHLGQAATANPSFAEAIAAEAFTSLLGQERLKEPTNASDPDYVALESAFESQRATIESLASGFIADQFDFKALVIAIVKTPQFRALSADKPDRLELIGFGGGTLTPPEILHRKTESIVGAPWVTAGGLSDPNPKIADPPPYLLSLKRFRLLAGGIDSRNIRSRARETGPISQAVRTRLALEMACEYVPYDLAKPRPERGLFPFVDRTLVPNGNAADAEQKPILDNLVYLHDRVLGETLAADDPELLETYKLLSDLQNSGMAAIGAGTSTKALPAPCQATQNYATGAPLPQSQQYTDDPQYVVRAWQGVVSYMLMDYRFTTEE